MEHLDVIERIITAERRARDIANAARERRSELDRALEAECADMRRTLKDRAQRRLEKVRENESAHADEQIKLLEEKLKGDLETLNQSYIANRENALDTLYRSITGNME